MASATAYFLRVLAFALVAMGALTSTMAQPAGSPLTGAVASAPAANAAGTVGLVSGDIRITRAGAAPRRAALGDLVLEGDTLISGRDSEVHLTMQDSGFIALRPNTRFRIISYKADGAEDDKGVFSLLVGGMRSVTGWIGKYNPTGYQVRTPSATIGIRGTDHETQVLLAGSTAGEAGTYDKVFTGGTSILSAGGKAEVAANQAGFVSPAATDRPRLLERIPAFFRSGPNEAEIDRKHAEIQQQINQRRAERQKLVAEKRAALNAARAELRSQQESSKAAAQQRQAAAQEQSRSLQQRREALRVQFSTLQATEKSLADRRKALKASGAGAQSVTAEQRAQLKALLAEEKEAREQRRSLEAARKALVDESETSAENRRKGLAQDLQGSLDRLGEVQKKAAELKQEREAKELEIKSMREQEQKRVREERQTDRQRRPASAAVGQ